MSGQVTPRWRFAFWANSKYQRKMIISSFLLLLLFGICTSRSSMNRDRVPQISESFRQKNYFRRTLKSKDSFRASLTSNEIYLDSSAATPGKLLDYLRSWRPQRQPWYSQRSSSQRLQIRFDENNWRHLSLQATQYLYDSLHYRHLTLKAKVVRCNKFNSSAKPRETKGSIQ